VAKFRADGGGVAADDGADGGLADAQGAGDAGRAVAHDVQRAQAQPRAASVQPGAVQGVAGDLGQGPFSGRGGLAAAGGQVVDGAGGKSRRGGDGPVGAAFVSQTVQLLADGAGGGSGPAGGGGGLTDLSTIAGAHVSLSLRPGDRVRSGALD